VIAIVMMIVNQLRIHVVNVIDAIATGAAYQ